MNSTAKYLKVVASTSFFTCAVLVIIYMIFQTQKDYQIILVNQTQDQLQGTAKSIAKSLEEFFTMKKNVLKSLATDPQLLEIGLDTDYSKLEMRYKELEGDIGGFYLISPEGIVTHRYPNKNRVGKDFSQKPGVSKVLKTKKPYVSDIFFSDSGKACITVLEPVLSQGKFYGILRALTYINKIETNFLKPVKSGKSGYIWIVGNNRKLIIHPDTDLIGKYADQLTENSSESVDSDDFINVINQMVNGKDGSAIYPSKWLMDSRGKPPKEITAYSKVILDNQHWSVAVSMDYSEIMTPIAFQMRKTFLLSAFIVMLFTAVGFIIYGKQRREEELKVEAENLKKLSDAAEALRLSEERLARSKKMESVGLLAGGVAHDLNNVLSGIVSYPELLLLNLPEDSELRKPLETIKVSGLKASAIVQDLLTMARGVAIIKEPLSLNEQITNFLHSPEYKKLEQFHPLVSVDTNLEENLLNINGSPIHVMKVIMNLVSNASEAIVDEGHVTIATSNRYIDRKQKKYDYIDEGEYAVLTVLDNGPGILPEDLERIFEPFYTKKKMGRSGTGLGLAVVWNVVQIHKGYIDVVSDSKGTTFDIYLPTTREKLADKPDLGSFKEYMGQGESILIVDDVETQLEVTRKMVETLGYTAATVASGEEAIEYLKKRSVDLLILDMIMEPGMSGKETYKKIITMYPAQKTILVSGFAKTDDVKMTQDMGAGEYLKKPITIKQLGAALKEQLSI